MRGFPMLPLTPTKLGRYEIVDEIGKGAMGVVYLARDPLIGRLVALKTFRIGYSVKDQEMEQFRARFIREAQSAGILSHPNIVTIHDVVEESEEGLAFIAMEYVRGTNLKSLLQGDQPLSLSFVGDVIAQVAEALDYAHSHRVIHRDVKPANILITADNRVKITDFGIARLDTSNLTQEGQLLGTPNYMAPEQIQGKEVDHRADLFALGVVLYEMLTRHKPFQGENLTVVSHRIVYDHFTPPREFVKELPPGVEAILNRSLDKDPNRRYQRAKEMVSDLRRVVGALSGDDLNETQSLAMAAAPVLTPPPAAAAQAPTAEMPILPPPLPALDGTGAAPPAAPAPQAAPAPPAKAAKPPKAPKPPRPPRTGPLFSLRRVTVAGVLAALLALMVGAAPFLWVSWTTPAKDRDAQEDATRARFLALLHTGEQHMKAGNAMAAAAVYREAEKLMPGPSVQQLRVAAERQAREQGALTEIETKISGHLMEAQQALEAREFDNALAAVNAALALDADNPLAVSFLKEVQTQQADMRKRATESARNRAQRSKTPQAVASTEPGAEPTPTSSDSTVAPIPFAQEATLNITFRSDLGGASVMVHVNGKNVLQGGVGSRGGFWRRSKAPDGPIHRSVIVPAGDTQLRIWVTPPGKSAVASSFTERLQPGGNYRLDIHLPKAGAAVIGLN
ncbi:MAG TPA: serine/threonine-protein kinase [Thermoanaerobaculia bacterium]